MTSVYIFLGTVLINLAITFGLILLGDRLWLLLVGNKPALVSPLSPPTFSSFYEEFHPALKAGLAFFLGLAVWPSMLRILVAVFHHLQGCYYFTIFLLVAVIIIAGRIVGRRTRGDSSLFAAWRWKYSVAIILVGLVILADHFFRKVSLEFIRPDIFAGTNDNFRYANIGIYFMQQNDIVQINQNYAQVLLNLASTYFGIPHFVVSNVIWASILVGMLLFLGWGLLRQIKFNLMASILGMLIIFLGSTALSLDHVLTNDAGAPFLFNYNPDALGSMGVFFVGILLYEHLRWRDGLNTKQKVLGLMLILAVVLFSGMSGPQNWIFIGFYIVGDIFIRFWKVEPYFEVKWKWKKMAGGGSPPPAISSSHLKSEFFHMLRWFGGVSGILILGMVLSYYLGGMIARPADFAATPIPGLMNFKTNRLFLDFGPVALFYLFPGGATPWNYMMPTITEVFNNWPKCPVFLLEDLIWQGLRVSFWPLLGLCLIWRNKHHPLQLAFKAMGAKYFWPLMAALFLLMVGGTFTFVVYAYKWELSRLLLIPYFGGLLALAGIIGQMAQQDGKRPKLWAVGLTLIIIIGPVRLYPLNAPDLKQIKTIINFPNSYVYNREDMTDIYGTNVITKKSRRDAVSQ